MQNNRRIEVGQEQGASAKLVVSFVGAKNPRL